MTMPATQTLVTRFGLTQIAGNQIVDWTVVENNYENLGNNAAHLSLSNNFLANQSIAGNLGITGIHRRLTTPVPAANESDRLMLMAEGNSSAGTYIGVCGPTAAPSGQRKASLVVHGVEPTGTVTPLGLVLNVDEDLHRASINAIGNYQDLTAPTLQLGAGGVDRLTMQATGPVALNGGMTMTGNFVAVNGAFSGTLTAAGAVAFTNGGPNALTVTGGVQLQGTLGVTGNATFQGTLTASNITGATVTLSGNLTVTGTTTLQSTLSVTGVTTLSNNLNVAGVTSLGGVLYFGAGAAYVQYYGSSYVQINQLTVTPGTLSTGPTIHNGQTNFNALVVCAGVNIQMSNDVAIYWNDQYHRIFSSSNNYFYFDAWQGWYWRSSSNGYPAAMSLDYAGNLNVVTALSVGTSGNFGSTVTSPYIVSNGNMDVGGGTIYFAHNGGINITYDGNIHFTHNVITNGTNYFFANNGGIWVAWHGSGYIWTSHNILVNGDRICFNGNGGIFFGGWDGSWLHTSHSLMLNGNAIGFANNGGIWIQWSGSGLQCSHQLTAPGVMCAGDCIVSATFYVRWGGTTTFQVAAQSGETYCNAPCHFSDGIFFYQVAAYQSYNGRANANAFLCPNNGDYSGQGLANQWRTWSGTQFKRNIAPINGALKLLRGGAMRGVRYDNIDHIGTGGGKHQPTGGTTKQVGFVADEWLEHFPEIVGVDANGKAESMDYSRAGAVMWEAFKEYIEETDGRLAESAALLQETNRRLGELAGELITLRANLASGQQPA